MFSAGLELVLKLVVTVELLVWWCVVLHYTRIIQIKKDTRASECFLHPPALKILTPIYRHICLMNHQETPQTNPIAPLGPLKT